MISTLPALIAALIAAHPGDTVSVAPGSYGRLVLNAVKTPGVTLDLTGATLTDLDAYNGAGGLTVENASFAGSANASVVVMDSGPFTFTNLHCANVGVACFQLTRAHDVDIEGGSVRASRGDGVDIAGSQRITVRHFSCAENVPTLTHPDCIQGWSLPGYQTTDVLIEGNSANGPTQGFDFWEHDPAIFSTRIILRDNTASISTANCWALMEATASQATGNICYTLAHAQWAAKGYPVHAPDLVTSGNVDGAAP